MPGTLFQAREGAEGGSGTQTLAPPQAGDQARHWPVAILREDGIFGE